MYKLSLILISIAFLGSCSKSLTVEETEQYTKQGKEIAEATAKNLGGNLVKKMKEGGPKMAIPFCNTKAYPLTDEISVKYGVKVKRTSHKLRNEKNKPTSQEVEILQGYKNFLENNAKLKPVVSVDGSGKAHFYAPIFLQKKCLACHGTVGKEVSQETDSIIKSYYANDLATGFKEGDLRGIWSITFN